MSERQSRKLSARQLILLGLFTTVLMIGALIFVALSSAIPRRGPVFEPLVGTWRSVKTEDRHGLGDSIWDLRDDGTARWRLSSGKSLGSAGNTTGYFEWWTEDSRVLATHQYSSEATALRSRLMSAVLGPQGGRRDFELIEVSEDEFKLRSNDGQKEMTYRRTHDATLEAVP